MDVDVCGHIWPVYPWCCRIFLTSSRSPIAQIFLQEGILVSLENWPNDATQIRSGSGFLGSNFWFWAQKNGTTLPDWPIFQAALRPPQMPKQPLVSCKSWKSKDSATKVSIVPLENQPVSSPTFQQKPSVILLVCWLLYTYSLSLVQQILQRIISKWLIPRTLVVGTSVVFVCCTP